MNFKLILFKILLIPILFISLDGQAQQIETANSPAKKSTVPFAAAAPSAAPPDDGGGGGGGGGGGSTNPPPAPSTSFSTSYYCGSTRVTRNSSPSGYIKWYWQTYSYGTSKSYSGSSYTFTSTRYVYLRAYDPATQKWGGYASPGYKHVNPNNLNAGNTNGAKTICYGASAGTLGNSSSASGGLSSYSYQWQVSSNNSSWSNISGATGTSYSPGYLTATRYYRRRVTSCGYTKYAASEKITVRSNLFGGNIGNPQTICYNGNPSTITNVTSASGGATLTYQWQKSPSGNAWDYSDISGANGSTYDPPSLTQTTWYRRKVTSSSGCGTQYTNGVQVFVWGNLTAGSIGNPQTLCYNGDPSPLTNTASPSGGTSRAYQWQKSTTSSSSGFSDVSGATGSTYDPPSLTQTTWYRRKVISGSGCGTQYTNVIQITIYGNLSAGSIGNGQVLCYNNDPSALTNVASATGSVSLAYQWQMSTTGASTGFTDISGATSSTYDPDALTQTTWYRREVNSGCGTAHTSALEITIHDDVEAGSIGEAQTLCYNEDPDEITNNVSASGGDTRTYQWQQSTTDASSGFTDISGATNETYDPPASTETTWYRRSVVSCGLTRSSNVIQISIYDDISTGVIINPSVLCYDGSGQITANSDAIGGDGIYAYQWQTSSDQINWLDMSGEENTELLLENQIVSAYYRREVNTSCGIFLSNAVFQEVKPAVEIGTIGSDIQICVEDAPEVIIGTDLSHISGLTYHWQESLDNETWTNIIGETQADYTPLAETKYYRRGVTYDGCTFYSTPKYVDAIICIAEAGEDVISTSDDQPVQLSGSPVGGTWTGSGIVDHTFDPRIAGEGSHQLTYTYTTVPGGTKQDVLTAEVTFTSVTPANLAKLTYQYKYDHRHRQIAKLVPGKGWEYLVYDKRDRLVLTQDANQRLEDRWSFVKYDQLNRAIITGEKVIAGDIETLRSAVEGHADLYETFDADGLVKYTNSAYPTGIVAEDVLSVTYYDNYAFTTETFQLPTGVFNDTDYKIIPVQTSHGVKGLTTGSMAKISGTTDQFVSSVNFYDDKYRLAQTVTKNHKGGTDRMTPQYQWRGLLMKTYVAHESPDVAIGNIAITQEYTYDRMGRHLTTTHQINSEPARTIVDKSYNELGQVKNKTLADGYDETNYAYNIRGWITQMNDPNDAEDHLFEMEFKYQDATHAKYDGNIGEVVWKNPFENATNGFDYEYDEMNRISAATGMGEASTNDLSNMKYDLNGNILNLTRKGTHELTTNQTIDQLIYTYEGNTNRLMDVKDASGKSTGFDDGNTEGDDYAYDANGNLIEDKNKGITSIEYNHINQPTKVIYDANKYMEYTYAGAAKVSQKLVDNGVEKVTDYIGSFIYENDSLQLIGHGEGRIVAERDLSGTFEGFEYQYHLRDHLGNVRVTFKTDLDTDEYLATLEDTESATEAKYFEKYDEVTKIKSPLFDHTTDSTGYAIWLDGSADRKIGLAKSLKVKPGDVIDMEVFAKYFNTGNSANWTGLLSTLAGQISSGAGGVVFEGMGSPTGLPFIDFLSGARTSGDAPAAYLNYFVFDENYQLISEKTGYQQISTAAEETGADTDHEELNHSITIDQSGYVYIYLSNEGETPIDVFFDDFMVTQTHSPVVQKDDYYPFGLSFNSYTRAASTAQNFKFNAGSELEEMTDWYSTPFRKYDPSLGRFHGVDALASMYTGLTPSHFGMNNPVNFNDPTGLNVAPMAGPDHASDGDAVNSAHGLGAPTPGGVNDWARAGNIGRYGRGGSLYNKAYGGIGLKPSQLRIKNSQKMNSMLNETWQSTCNNCANTYSYNNGTLVGVNSLILYGTISMPGSNYGTMGGNQLASLDSRGIGAGLVGIRGMAAPSMSSGGSSMESIMLASVVVNGRRLQNGGGRMEMDLNYSGIGGDFNSNIDLGLTVAGSVAGAFETGTAIGTLQSLKSISLSTAKTGIRLTKHLGAFGFALTGAVAGYEVYTGQDNTHTWVDIGVTITGGVVIGMVGAAALPAVAAGGLVYGIWSATGGSDWIDNNWGYRSTKTK